LPAEHAERRIVITANTAATRWLGERMDYGVAIDAMLFRESHARGENHDAATEARDSYLAASGGARCT
jgi:hypothetical protein